eukprot:Lithocolla_globosa_v1_NODE_9732_length_674_cov_3.966074.p1 type:complete len:133 gc:universal NODE_9732_length_674_cov_3.966074:427-29(-)
MSRCNRAGTPHKSGFCEAHNFCKRCCDECKASKTPPTPSLPFTECYRTESPHRSGYCSAHRVCKICCNRCFKSGVTRVSSYSLQDKPLILSQAPSFSSLTSALDAVASDPFNSTKTPIKPSPILRSSLNSFS